MPTQKICNFDDIQVGEYLSEVQYYKVLQKTDKQLTVVNVRGTKIDVTSDVVEEGMYSASQYTEEKHVTRTELGKILEGAGDAIFTVCFHKKAKTKEVTEQLLDLIDNADLSDPKAFQKQLRTAVKEALEGKQRVLIGHLLQSEPKMGRSQVRDLEAPPPNNIRLVDHRTLEWLILKNVKYSLK